ncbi:MAG: hypothetical protein Q9164_002734 [Protoblastenia rupestris]
MGVVQASPIDAKNALSTNVTAINELKSRWLFDLKPDNVPKRLRSTVFDKKSKVIVKGLLREETGDIKNCCKLMKDRMDFCWRMPGLSDTHCKKEDKEYDACRINIGRSAEGLPWMACYVEGPMEEITTSDAAAMRCLIDERTRRESFCFPMAGSPCAAGYTGQMKIGQGQGGWGDGPISAEASRTYQAAADSLVGTKRLIPDLYLWTVDDQWHQSGGMDFDNAFIRPYVII